MKQPYTLSVHRHARAGFTLIELLVVISIIAMLIAMLLPALSKARRAATFVQCGSNLRQLAMGVLTYTGDYKGAYPYRVTRHSGAAGELFVIKQTAGSLTVDDRPALKQAYQLNLMQCPFSVMPITDTQSFELSTSRIIYSSYELYFGSRLNDTIAASGLYRVDDRPVLGGNQFRVLASDSCRHYTTPGIWTSSHPDTPGTMDFAWFYNTDYTVARWAVVSPARNALDRNFVYDDGSIRSFSNITMTDSRFVQVPWSSMTPSNGVYAYLPPN